MTCLFIGVRTTTSLIHFLYIYFLYFTSLVIMLRTGNIYEDDNNDTSNFSSSQCKHKFQFSLGLKRTL